MSNLLYRVNLKICHGLRNEASVVVVQGWQHLRLSHEAMTRKAYGIWMLLLHLVTTALPAQDLQRLQRYTKFIQVFIQAPWFYMSLPVSAYEFPTMMCFDMFWLPVTGNVRDPSPSLEAVGKLSHQYLSVRHQLHRTILLRHCPGFHLSALWIPWIPCHWDWLRLGPSMEGSKSREHAGSTQTTSELWVLFPHVQLRSRENYIYIHICKYVYHMYMHLYNQSNQLVIIYICI